MSLFHDFSNVSTAAVLILSLSAYPQEIDNPGTQKTDLKLDNTLSSEVVLPIKAVAKEIPSLVFYYGFNELELSDRHEQQVKDVAKYLLKSGDTFEIRGCTSKTGSDDTNFGISYRRANAVLEALEKEGVPVTKYEDIVDKDGNEIIGQDRDVYGESENCPSLVDGTKDNNEESRRARVILNPVYEEPVKITPSSNTGNGVNLLEFLNKIMQP